MPFSMTRLKKNKNKNLVAWSIFKDVQDQEQIIYFEWPNIYAFTEICTRGYTTGLSMDSLRSIESMV